MILTSNVEMDIMVALISAVFGSIITLLFQWFINNIGKTKFYIKIIEINENRLFKMKIKATHTKKNKFLVNNISLKIYGEDDCLELIQCDKSVIKHHGIEQQYTPEVKTYRYNYVLTDEYVLEEELNFYSKHPIDLNKYKFYLIINNREYYPLKIKKLDYPKYELLKKISKKERKKLDGPYE